MTTFKVGDRVRRLRVSERYPEGFETTVLGFCEEGNPITRNAWGELDTWPYDRFELVIPAPSEPDVHTLSAQQLQEAASSASVKFMKLNTEFNAFKAKVVEELKALYMISELLPEELDSIMRKLGLLPAPSRYRVTFEVDAEDEHDALEKARRDAMGATVEKIDEDK